MEKNVKPFPGKTKPRRVIRCPANLSAKAKRHWKYVIARADGYESLDVDLLALYCEAWGRWEEAQDYLGKTGLVVKGTNDAPMPSPYLPIANKAFDQLRSLLPELQMTPKSRGASVVSRDDNDDDWWEKI